MKNEKWILLYRLDNMVDPYLFPNKEEAVKALDLLISQPERSLHKCIEEPDAILAVSKNKLVSVELFPLEETTFEQWLEDEGWN